MGEDKINSNESEGAFNEFINDKIEDMIEDIINTGDIEQLGDGSSEIVIEMDDITPPVFEFDSGGSGQGGGRGRKPGDQGEKIRFSLPYRKFIEMIAEKLNLPNLKKEGKGKIKEISYKYKTFGPTGAILDKKRTFKRALKTSVCTGQYDPAKNKYDIAITKRDKRFKRPEREENPKYKAVVFFMGDISYSTYGERLELEKRLINFIVTWLNFNYGEQNVEHRFFVHDVDAYEVNETQFFNINNAGGTRAACVFELIYQIAVNEYEVPATNFYAFYFGDGELFSDDARKISEILEKNVRPLCNRVGIVEVKPSSLSQLNRQLGDRYIRDSVVRITEIQNRNQTIKVIKDLFGEYNASNYSR